MTSKITYLSKLHTASQKHTASLLAGKTMVYSAFLYRVFAGIEGIVEYKRAFSRLFFIFSERSRRKVFRRRTKKLRLERSSGKERPKKQYELVAKNRKTGI